MTNYGQGLELPVIAKIAIEEINARGTQTPQGMPTPSGTEITEGLHTTGTQTPVCTYKEVERIVETYLPNVSTALKIALAVATSGIRKNRVMLWLLLVGSPSSGKTDLVRLFKHSKKVFSVDNLTLNAFISGERPTDSQKVHDLLPKLDSKCLIVKDWTVIFSLDERMTKKIIGDMVGAYDKSLAKFSSRRGQIVYNSEFSHLGCITPSTLNKHHNYLNMIGPRFLSYIIPELSEADENKSFNAIFGEDDRQEKEEKTSQIVSNYLDELNNRDISMVEAINTDVQKYLRIASRFMAKARGIVITQSAKFLNEESQEVTYYEPLDVQIEQPWRAVQQLMVLSKYLAIVTEKVKVGPEECQIVKEIVTSSMPADRSQALKALKNSLDGEVTAKELADDTNKSTKTARRLLDELIFLGIVEKDKGSGTRAASYKLVKEFKDFICMDSSEFMSHKINEKS